VGLAEERERDEGGKNPPPSAKGPVSGGTLFARVCGERASGLGHLELSNTSHECPLSLRLLCCVTRRSFFFILSRVV